MGRRCPRSKALGLARLERHRLAVMREGWLTAVRNPSSAVHGVLWDLALSDIPALDRHESLSKGLYVKLTQSVIAERGPKRAIVYIGANSGLHVRRTLRRSWPRRVHGRFRARASRRWRDWRCESDNGAGRQRDVPDFGSGRLARQRGPPLQGLESGR